ncbi:MAG: protein BatD, partial [Bacteroidaceae bacterium]|nr:protein BatD [Bacteroidaceae bacterium]
MKKILYLFVMLAAVAMQVRAAGDVSFTASAPKAVVKGKQFRLSYTVTTQKVKDFRAPSFGDAFEVLMGPSQSHSSSTSIVNGEVSSTSTITYTYILLGTEEGEYSIPAATIVANGESLSSNTLKIKVLPPDQTAPGQQGGSATGRRGGTSPSASSSSGGQISDRDLFITATVNKANVFEQEAILLTYKVYFLVNLRSLEIKMPDLKGFHTQEVELQRGEPQLEHYNGRNYNTIVWSQYVLFPQQTGKLEIPSINFEGVMAVRTQRSMDPFDIFMNGGAGYVDVRKTISTPKLTVNVSPLPAGKPAGFSGGVGEFKLNSSISTTELKTNDAVTLKLE